MGPYRRDLDIVQANGRAMNELSETQKNRLFWLAAGLIVALAFVMRIVAANGELWLDEIWSLKLLEPIRSPDQIFWKINHANNHFLNSLWMYELGPDAPGLLLRLPAVLFGTAMVAAAGYWNIRRGRFAILTAMLLIAVSYIMVDLGSEARGYAGLLLATLLALRFVEDATDGTDRKWLLGLVILFGMLSQILMIMAIVVLVAWALWSMTKRNGDFLHAVRGTTLLFLPALVLTSPIVIVVGRAVLRHQFTIGPRYDFDPENFIHGFGRLIESCLKLPVLDNALTYAAVAQIVGVAWYLQRNRADCRPALYLIGITLIPLLMFMAHMPVATLARYFIFSGMALMLLIADMAGFLWQNANRARLAALCLLAVLMAGNAVFLYKFYQNGRGHYREAMAAMTVDGVARYGAPDYHNAIVEQHFARELGITPEYVPFDRWCAAPPPFLLLYQEDHEAPAAKTRFGPASCPASFDSPQLFPAWGLSGSSWIVYRRSP